MDLHQVKLKGLKGRNIKNEQQSNNELNLNWLFSILFVWFVVLWMSIFLEKVLILSLVNIPLNDDSFALLLRRRWLKSLLLEQLKRRMQVHKHRSCFCQLVFDSLGLQAVIYIITQSGNCFHRFLFRTPFKSQAVIHGYMMVSAHWENQKQLGPNGIFRSELFVSNFFLSARGMFQWMFRDEH